MDGELDRFTDGWMDRQTVLPLDGTTEGLKKRQTYIIRIIHIIIFYEWFQSINLLIPQQSQH